MIGQGEGLDLGVREGQGQVSPGHIRVTVSAFGGLPGINANKQHPGIKLCILAEDTFRPAMHGLKRYVCQSWFCAGDRRLASANAAIQCVRSWL